MFFLRRRYFLVVAFFLAGLCNRAYGRPVPFTPFATDTVRFLTPEFYNPVNQKVADSTYIFKCYDKDFTPITSVLNYDDVHFYSLFKNYTDSGYKYKTAEGTKEFLPVSYIVKRYDKIGKNKWTAIFYPANRMVEYREDRNVIVRTDTLHVIDSATHAPRVQIFRYYKVSPIN